MEASSASQNPMLSFEETLASINGGPKSPPFIFGLQRRPGLAGQQPRIEDYNSRHEMARQIMGASMSQRAHQICVDRQRRCHALPSQLIRHSKHFVHLVGDRNAARVRA
jgi:hypothetical protein